jgi:hypothetical protein
VTDAPRLALVRAAAKEQETFAALSRMIGKDDGYLSRYRRGLVARLKREDATLLGRYLGIDPRQLGGDAPPPLAPKRTSWRPETPPQDEYQDIGCMFRPRRTQRKGDQR